jgi:hypothetical protein
MVWRRSTRVEITVSFIEVMIIKTWRAAQSAVQVGTRRMFSRGNEGSQEEMKTK